MSGAREGFSGRWPDAVAEGRVDVWVCSGLLETEVEACRNALSAEEWERTERYHFERDRRRFAGSRFFLRTVLGRYAGTKAAALAFRQNEWGKPALSGGEICFSLSRSHDVALLAVSGEELGADVEWRDRQRADEAIVRRQFSEPEQRHVLDAEDKKEAFFEIWTGKEAYIKALGYGLLHPLDAFSVRPSEGGGERARVVEDWSTNAPDGDWYVRGLPLPIAGYAAALATKRHPVEAMVIPVTLAELEEG